MQLDEKDRDVTRFVWLTYPYDLDSEIITYRFKAILFGATCSPFILNATLLKCLQDNDGIWVSEMLKRNLYVDDILSSFSSEEEVLSYFRDTRNLMSSAGFNLRSWNLNSNNICKLALAENVLDADQVTKVLEIFWDAEKDKLFLRLNPIQKRDVVTKRYIL